jgi:hypothetical protein
MVSLIVNLIALGLAVWSLVWGIYVALGLRAVIKDIREDHRREK